MALFIIHRGQSYTCGKCDGVEPVMVAATLEEVEEIAAKHMCCWASFTDGGPEYRSQISLVVDGKETQSWDIADLATGYDGADETLGGFVTHGAKRREQSAAVYRLVKTGVALACTDREPVAFKVDIEPIRRAVSHLTLATKRDARKFIEDQQERIVVLERCLRIEFERWCSDGDDVPGCRGCVALRHYLEPTIRAELRSLEDYREIDTTTMQ